MWRALRDPAKVGYLPHLSGFRRLSNATCGLASVGYLNDQIASSGVMVPRSLLIHILTTRNYRQWLYGDSAFISILIPTTKME